MAIIRCPGCAQRVSSLAASCARCGVPLKDASRRRGAVDARHRRRKRVSYWLAQSLIATALFVAGSVMFLGDREGALLGIGSAAYALPLMAVGAGWYLIVRVVSWWQDR